jgi:hypothetical protein
LELDGFGFDNKPDRRSVMIIDARTNQLFWYFKTLGEKKEITVGKKEEFSGKEKKDKLTATISGREIYNKLRRL